MWIKDQITRYRVSALPNCILGYLSYEYVKKKLLKLIGVDEEEDGDSQGKMLQEGYSISDYEGFMEFLKDYITIRGFEVSKTCHYFNFTGQKILRDVRIYCRKRKHQEDCSF